MIRLRFVTCNDWVSRTIRGAQLGFWASHVEAQTVDGYLGAHASGGVAVRPIGYDASEMMREAFAEIPGDERAFFAFLRGEIGAPYDLDAIGDLAEGAVLARSPDASKDRGWICSGLISAALQHASFVPMLPAGRLTTPRDLLQICAGLRASFVGLD